MEKELKRNLTISLPKSLIIEAKVAAARDDTSLTAFIKQAMENELHKAAERDLDKIEKRD